MKGRQVRQVDIGFSGGKARVGKGYATCVTSQVPTKFDPHLLRPESKVRCCFSSCFGKRPSLGFRWGQQKPGDPLCLWSGVPAAKRTTSRENEGGRVFPMGS